MSSRFEAVVDAARAEKRKLAGIFLTNGFPDLESSREILRAVDEGGADFVELGMPFSDPLAEGLPIQRSSARALAGGVRMIDTLETAAHFRARSETPLFLMGYVNPILRYGVSNFFADAASSGVDGLIIPDLPPGASTDIPEAADRERLGLVHLIAPNTADERIREVDRASTAFVYAVSVTGLTGSAIKTTDAVQDYLRRARSLVTRNPLLVGFGIKTRDEAVRLSAHTDGFIVGSALIQRVDELWGSTGLSREERLSAVTSYVEGLRGGVGAAM